MTYIENDFSAEVHQRDPRNRRSPRGIEHLAVESVDFARTLIGRALRGRRSDELLQLGPAAAVGDMTVSLDATNNRAWRVAAVVASLDLP